jgi:hypothetical protein
MRVCIYVHMVTWCVGCHIHSLSQAIFISDRQHVRSRNRFNVLTITEAMLWCALCGSLLCKSRCQWSAVYLDVQYVCTSISTQIGIWSRDAAYCICISLVVSKWEGLFYCSQAYAAITSDPQCCIFRRENVVSASAIPSVRPTPHRDNPTPDHWSWECEWRSMAFR